MIVHRLSYIYVNDFKWIHDSKCTYYIFLHTVHSKGAAKAMEVVESSDNESIQSGEEGNDREEERESRADCNPVGSSQQAQVS